MKLNAFLVKNGCSTPFNHCACNCLVVGGLLRFSKSFDGFLPFQISQQATKENRQKLPFLTRNAFSFMILLCSVRPKPDSVSEDKNLLFFSPNNFQNVFIFSLVFLLLEGSFEQLEIEHRHIKNILKIREAIGCAKRTEDLKRLEQIFIASKESRKNIECQF